MKLDSNLLKLAGQLGRGFAALAIALSLLGSGYVTAAAAPITAVPSGSNTAGILWLAGSLGGHQWVSDATRGFCRLYSAVPGQVATVNFSTCFTFGAGSTPGQATRDPLRNFVYVPDSSLTSQGVWRLLFDPATERISSAELLVPATELNAANQPAATALGPDGSLYVSFLNSGEVVRIMNPAGGVRTAQIVGRSASGQGARSLAFAGNALFLAEERSVSTLSGATTCSGLCQASPLAAQFANPTALLSQGRYVLLANASQVVRYDTVYRTLSPLASSAQATAALRGVTALSLDAAGNLWAATAGGVLNVGQVS